MGLEWLLVVNAFFVLQADKQKQHAGSLLEEANILREMNHPNVLRFYGLVVDQEGASVGIITEYMRGGSLAAVLRYGQPLFVNCVCCNAQEVV